MHVNQLLIISAIWTVSGVSGVPIPQSSSADAENRAALLYGIGGGAAGLFVGLGLGGLLVDRNNRVEKHWAQRDAFYAKPELVQCLYEHLELPETVSVLYFGLYRCSRLRLGFHPNLPAPFPVGPGKITNPLE